MSVTTQAIADFVCWLSAPSWQKDKVVIGLSLRPTNEQVTLIYGARKALQIMERLPRNSERRTRAIGECRALFDRILGQCAYQDRPKPNAQVDISREELPALSQAASLLIEFNILKVDEANRMASQNKQRWADRGQGRGNR
jgi:hypothetical protein